MTISAVVHTKNSASTLKAALESVKWVDEIVVVDAKSTDDSKSIAREYTSKIYDFEDIDYVEVARNFGISKASCDWILILDADEEITATLKQKLIALTDADKDAWKLPRKNLMFREWIQHAGWWPDYNVRFFKKGAVDWPAKIHAQPIVTGQIGIIDPQEDCAIIHHNYETVADYITRLNKYTNITVTEGTKVSDSAFDAFFQEFMRRFIAEEGYKDHTLGLSMSLLQSFYQAVASIKQWEQQGKQSKKVRPDKLLNSMIHDMCYWRAHYNVLNSKNIFAKLWWQVRRKFNV